MTPADRAETAEGRRDAEDRVANWHHSRAVLLDRDVPAMRVAAMIRDGDCLAAALTFHFDRAEAAEARLINADQQAQALMRQGLVLQEEITRLRGRLAVAMEALELADRALNNWILTYASDMCDADKVDAAHEEMKGGTIGYIAGIQEEIGQALGRGDGRG